MYEKILQEIGLNEKEAVVYETILETGPVEARKILKKISKKIKTTRSNLYNILASLKKKELLIEKTKKGKTLFEAESPTNLIKLFEESAKKTEQTKRNLELIIPALKSLYHLTTLKPSVIYFEGLEGLKSIFKDILKTKANLSIFASKLDKEHPDFAKLIESQIKKQFRKNIKTRAIVRAEIDINEIKKAAGFGIKQRGLKNWGLDSQIIIYGNKIAITSFKGSFISTLIEDKSIADSFRKIFEFVWENAIPFQI